VNTGTNTTRDDRELVRRARGGDLASFEILVTRYEKRIFSLARRITGSDQDAEDVTQHAFIQALKSLPSFREASSFTTWLTSIAAHAALKVLRKRRGIETVSLDAAITPDDDGTVPHPEYIAEWKKTPAVLAQNRETGRILDAAILALDPIYRAVFLLRDVEELSIAETARALAISETNVKIRLLRARLQLRERLTRILGDPRRRVPPHAHGRPQTVEKPS